jgi:Flp pilus assembly protein TadB
VRLLRRRSDSPADVDPDDPVGVTDSAGQNRPAGKGRPTPRRREAQRRRTGPVAPPPKTRREALRRMRARGSDRRSEARDGLRAGDERYLTPRDRGAERMLVRNIVDSRRNAGVLFLLSAVVYFVGLLVPSVQVKAAITALWLTVLILLVVDSTVIGLRIRKLMRERFPDSDQKLSGLVFYGATRATMIRRWRAPKPVVQVGDSI